MDWVKELGPTAASEAWRDDFPLDHELPPRILIDCRRIKGAIHPMFAVRLRVFIDWHRSEGREVDLLPPKEAVAHSMLGALALLDGAGPSVEDTVMPVTGMKEFPQVEEVAGRTQEILEYQLTDVSPLGGAAFMAVSELCGNAIDHGRNALVSYAAVCRVTEPRKIVRIAISDLGVGIPEHIRQRYPEWDDDGWAIAHATDERVTGTDDLQRGFGFSSVIEAALTQALHAAQMEILSARGHCRLGLVQENRKVEVFPAPGFRRGTWITYDLISV